MKWGNLFRARLLQVGLAILCIAATIVAFRDPLDIDDRPHITRVLKLAANSVQADIAADMEARILAQVRLAQLSNLHAISPREWDAAANLFLSHHPGYVAVQLFDKTYHLRRTAVVREQTSSPNVADVLANPRLQDILQAKDLTDRRAATSALTLQDGTSAYLLVVPTFAEEQVTGFLVAVCDVESTLDHILSDHAELGYSIAVLRDSGQLYQMKGSTSEYRKSWSQAAKVHLAELDWRVEVWPKPEMVAEARSRLPEIGVIFALLLLMLLASTVHFARMVQVKSDDVRAAHDNLELRVRERTAELKQTNEDLHAEIMERKRVEETLRELSAHLLHVQDDERRRIARELHDSTAQTLSALKLNLSNLRNGAWKNICASHRILEQSVHLAEQALSEIRSMSYLLHPPILEDFGLESTLTWYVEGFSERSGVQVDLDFDPSLGRFSPDVELTLFRVVQEALGNIYRHSGSRRATIRVYRQVSERNVTEIALQVADEGCGLPTQVLDPAPGAMPRVGLGIAGMRERVRQLGGQFEITSCSRGATIEVVLPCAEARSLTPAA